MEFESETEIRSTAGLVEVERRRPGRSVSDGVGEAVEELQTSAITSSRGESGGDDIGGSGEVCWRGGIITPSLRRPELVLENYSKH